MAINHTHRVVTHTFTNNLGSLIPSRPSAHVQLLRAMTFEHVSGEEPENKATVYICYQEHVWAAHMLLILCICY